MQHQDLREALGEESDDCLEEEDETSHIEKKGGEYFYCSRCNKHIHADINAARNIIHVQHSSDVSGGTTDISLS